MNPTRRFVTGNIDIEVDAYGYPTHMSEWTDEVARALGRSEGVANMTDGHWKVVFFIREYYQKHGKAPDIKTLCESTGFAMSVMYQLFPTGPAKGACKIAGLPNAWGCH